MHDAFVTVWRKIDRVRARRHPMDLDNADERSLLRTGPNPTWEATLGRRSTSEMRGAIGKLPEEQRRAIELAYFVGYTHREVAVGTGVAAGTANGRLRLALDKLRESLTGTTAAPLAVWEPIRREEAHR